MSDINDKESIKPEESEDTNGEDDETTPESESDYGALTSGYDSEPSNEFLEKPSSSYTTDDPYTLQIDPAQDGEDIELESPNFVEESEETSAPLAGLEDHGTDSPNDNDESLDDKSREELSLDRESYGIAEIADDAEQDEIDEQENGVPEELTGVAPQTMRIIDEPPLTRVGVFFASIWLAIPIMLLGIGLRAAWYWRNRALWHDEGNLTVEMVGRTFRELLEPLGNEQSAPIGFLLIVKSIISVFGTHEFALRGFPLFASCAAIIVVYFLGRKITDKGSVALALTIFAVSLPLMRYGSELKQYSTDVLIAAIITLMAVGILRSPFTRGPAILFALAGALAIWLSHPALFILAGSGIALGTHALLARDWKKAGGLILIALVWAGSFALDYYVSLRLYAEDEILRSWHIDSYFLLPPNRPWPAAIKWVIWRFVDMFQWPMGLALPGLGVVGFFIGLGTLWKTRRAELFVLFLPILAALGASHFGRYPIANRFLHFFAPALILITAAGLVYIVRALWTRSRIAAVTLILCVLIQPAIIAVNEIVKEPKQGARPVVSYLKDHQQTDDKVYLFFWLRNEFNYYAEEHYDYDMTPVQVGITSRRDWTWYKNEMQSFAGNDRVWFAFIDNEDHLGQGERQYFETTLNEMGTQLDKQTWAAYTLYLYDLSAAPVLETKPDSTPQEKISSESGAEPAPDSPKEESSAEITEDTPIESVERIDIE